MKKIAVSIGDVNGVGLEIAIKAHKIISKDCEITYFVDECVLKSAGKLLNCKIPDNFKTKSIKNFILNKNLNNLIQPSKITKESGEYSFVSFKTALQCVVNKEFDAILTLPINKESWNKAGIKFAGHTEFLSKYFNNKGIMMLGCEKLFVALFSDHIPIKKVSKTINFNDLVHFLIKFKNSFNVTKSLVLGLNPHAGDGGVLGSEDFIIKDAINFVNKKFKNQIFFGPISPDIAFSPQNRNKFKVFVAMYHDQGLIPIKTLYFEESINITLGLPVVRTSVDHGTAFDIAYQNKASIKSYLEAKKFILEH